MDDLTRTGGANSFDWAEAERNRGDWEAEYHALTSGAGLVDTCASTRVELIGADRAAFLHRLCTNRVDALGAGRGCETFLTDAKGHILAHVLVFAGADSFVLRTVPGEAERICGHLDRYILREDVEARDLSSRRAELLLAGPESEGLLERLGLARLPAERLSHVETTLAGTAVWAGRVDLAGPVGFLLSCPPESAVDLWQALQGAGARPCGRQAAEAVRIESGWPDYGRDITEENLPQEVARDAAAISFDKGCYLGQEIVARIDSRGHVNRTLVGLKFTASEVPPAGTQLTADGRPAGRVTSGAFSVRLGCAVALGYVRRGQNRSGTRLDSALGPAEVTALPMPTQGSAL